MLCALGFEMYFLIFFKGELRGKKNQDLGELPQRRKVSWLVGDGPAILSVF